MGARSTPAVCKHFWYIVELLGYGYISLCENCDARQSAEHTQKCFESAIYLDKPCICGAEEEFQKFLGARSTEETNET